MYSQEELNRARSITRMIDLMAVNAIALVSERAHAIGCMPQQLAECIAVDIYRTLKGPQDLATLPPTEDAPQEIRDAINLIETACVEWAESVNGPELQFVRRFIASHLAQTAAKTYLGIAIQNATDDAIEKRKKVTESN